MEKVCTVCEAAETMHKRSMYCISCFEEALKNAVEKGEEKQ